MVRGESQKSEYIGKMGGKTVYGGLVGEGPNRSYNKDLMHLYRKMYHIIELIKDRDAYEKQRASLGLNPKTKYSHRSDSGLPPAYWTCVNELFSKRSY